MNRKIFPPKLKTGDGVRILAPANSLANTWITEELKQVASQRLADMGLNLTYSKFVNELDDFDSSSIENRINDLHEAFADKSIKFIQTVVGGFNSNQLLRYLDYNLIKDNPKIICGESDLTALINAIYAKTGLIGYCGPSFFSFGDKKSFDYSLEYFKKCLMSDKSFEIIPSVQWSDDLWEADQKNRHFTDNEGFWIINEGEAEGILIGGNQSTFNLLHGTEYMPSLIDGILFLEDDDETHPATIDRDLQSIIHQPNFNKVKAIAIGRFQKATRMSKVLLTQIIKTKKELRNIPVIGNVDFGHTTPQITYPIGGKVQLIAKNNAVKLNIVEH